MHDPIDTTHVIYHANCYDGFGAAWAAWHGLNGRGVYIPAKYGDSPPELPREAKVVIADFSYPREALLKLKESVSSIVVLDHHKTAQKDLDGLDFAKFDLNHSGAWLAWDFFHPNHRHFPNLIMYVQDRDLWRFHLQHSKEVSAVLQSIPYDFDEWDAFDDHLRSLDSVVTEGRAILRAKDQMVEQMAKNHRFRHMAGFRIPVANAACYFSEVGEALCLMYPEAPFAAYYFDRADGKRQWGLRSRGGFDVSEVAKKFGGGGHPAAAGFTEEIPY